MNFLQAVCLGVVQGVTEFFPVSSSGHLILLPRLFDWPSHLLAFDAVLHLGTGLAVPFYFWRDWLEMLRSLVSDVRHRPYDIRRFSETSQQLLFIAAASIPVGIAGLAFSDFVESHLRSPQTVATALFVVALLMLAAEKVVSVPPQERTSCKTLVIGFSQVLALIPGVSRSGITITTGLFCGLEREEAARFSFLLATPIVLAAGSWGLISSASLNINYLTLITGFLTSFLSGFLAIKFFLDLLKRFGLWPFAIYRIFLSLLIFVLLI